MLFKLIWSQDVPPSLPSIFLPPQHLPTLIKLSLPLVWVGCEWDADLLETRNGAPIG